MSRRRRRRSDRPKRIVPASDTSRIASNVRRLGMRTYREYLDSDYWAAAKKRYSRSYRPQDCPCGAIATHLHHLTYLTLGAEHPDDLIALCNWCHLLAHGRRRKRRRKKRKSSIKVTFVAPEPRSRKWEDVRKRIPDYDH